MKFVFCHPRLLFVAITGLLLMGCLSQRATVSPRHFLLAPIAANEPAPPATERFSVGIGFVKMPSYLLRTSMAVRHGTNEIKYLHQKGVSEAIRSVFVCSGLHYQC